MAVWGFGSFENEYADNWAAQVNNLDDVRELFALSVPKGGAAGLQSGEELSVETCSQLIAGAEIVAMRMGREVPDFPNSLKERLGDATVDDKLIEQAQAAVAIVLRESPLAEIWSESSGGEDTNAWLIEVTGLIDRLNPDKAYTPPSEVDGQEIMGNCIFCDEPVYAESSYVLNFCQCGMEEEPTEGLLFHLHCLNSRLHHKHAVIDLPGKVGDRVPNPN